VLQRDLFGVTQFLQDYPGMSIRPCRSADLILKGNFAFSAKPKNGLEITDSYNLEITVSAHFPDKLPIVTDTQNKIPQNGYHLNPDHTLCLGSPLRIRSKMHEDPTLTRFAESCLVPYLYAVSIKLQNGENFVFGELMHGEQGIIDDYCDLFDLRTHEQVIQTLKLLGMKKRIANKKSCPCGCRKRLGKCFIHHKLNNYRKMVPRYWFNTHVKNLATQM
jgi:hypothetical protein